MDLLVVERIVWMKTRGRCFYCKTPVSRYAEVKMIKDHFLPVSLGGPDDHSNLVPSCKKCDREKGGTIPKTCPQHLRAGLRSRAKEPKPKQQPSPLLRKPPLKGNAGAVIFRYWYTQENSNRYVLFEARAQTIEEADKKLLQRTGFRADQCKFISVQVIREPESTGQKMRLIEQEIARLSKQVVAHIQELDKMMHQEPTIRRMVSRNISIDVTQ